MPVPVESAKFTSVSIFGVAACSGGKGNNSSALLYAAPAATSMVANLMPFPLLLSMPFPITNNILPELFTFVKHLYAFIALYIKNIIPTKMLDFKGGFVARIGAFQQKSAKKAKNDEISCCKLARIVVF